MNRRARDEHTARTLAYLHEARWATRGEKRRSQGLVLYTIALLAAFWGIPALVMTAPAGRPAQPGPLAEPHSAATAHILSGLPVALPVLLLLVVAALVRTAVWRGPVTVDQPTAHWLLRTPLERGPLLLPRLARSSGMSAAVGLTLGGAGGFLLYGYGPHPWAAATAAGAWAGLAAGVASSALGVCVEWYDEWVARSGARLFALVWAVLALAAGAAGLLVCSGTPGWAARLFLWSGPWGWTVQPLVSAMGGTAGLWGVGAVLSAASVAALALVARHGYPWIPLAALRRRATVASAVASSLMMLDLRSARAGVPGLRRAGSRPAVRLPVPRRSSLLVPWRDATSLLRSPGRLCRAALCTAAAALLVLTSYRMAGGEQDLVCVGAVLAQYLAAAQLTEPARLESDDTRRRAGLPWSAAGLALRHAIVPAVLLYGGLAVAAAVCRPAGALRPGLAVLAGAVPAVVGAALVSSYRGAVPFHFLVGVQTAMGNTAPLQSTVWYLRGPGAAVLVTTVVLFSVVHGGTYTLLHALVQLGAGAAGLWWGGWTARRLHTR